jgi:hypothetical protein
MGFGETEARVRPLLAASLRARSTTGAKLRAEGATVLTDGANCLCVSANALERRCRRYIEFWFTVGSNYTT